MSQDLKRPDKLIDLTRWNRAGLQRFEYIDGDAAVWLEELRIALMGLYARGADLEHRLPESWRSGFAHPPVTPPDFADQTSFFDQLAWEALGRRLPEEEASRVRNRRLLRQYEENSGEYGWEIMRAAARATHVQLAHLNAFANEGYLRTATQWDSLRKLAAMVNYHPAPPTSAITTIGLMLEPSEDGAAVEIARGLPMKYTPPEGGAPVVFETLLPLKSHSDLNEARAVGWNRDPTVLSASEDWLDDDKAALSPGALGLLARDGVAGGMGVLMNAVARDVKSGLARITLSQIPSSWARGDTSLHVDAKETRRALPRSTAGVLVLELATASNYQINSTVKIHHSGGSSVHLVIGNSDGHLKLACTHTLGAGSAIRVETLVPVSDTAGAWTIDQAGTSPIGGVSGAIGVLLGQAKAAQPTAYYLNRLGQLGSDQGVPRHAVDEDGKALTAVLGVDFSHITDAIGSLFVESAGAKMEEAVVVGDPAAVVPGQFRRKRIVSFAGKPPKGLATGDFMAMRPEKGGAPLGLTVVGVATANDTYTLQFDIDLSSEYNTFKPDQFVFHGPFARSLRLLNFDRDPAPAFTGAEIVLTGLRQDARELVRLGRTCLIEDETGASAPVLAHIIGTALLQSGQSLKIVFETAEGLAGFKKGWTKVNLNAVTASHGETKSPKVLGSGDAEKSRQSFGFSSKSVSFIPSSVAETGVAPDMDVAINGLVWPFRDLIDPTADDTESYSISTAEDGALTVHFRCRLRTGTNNVVVKRYRTGVGAGGTIPAHAFTKPMKKHRWVSAISQPFGSSGGAEREPIEDIRENAPARLASNGRAVSLTDFERLCQRRSDVWQASAQVSTNPSRPENLEIVIVPANGGTIGDTFKDALIEFVESRALPGVRVAISGYVAVHLVVATTIRVDVETYDKTIVQAAAQTALAEAFALEHRILGQPLYISEVVAALERVPGVETAQVDQFALSGTAPGILRIAKTANAPSAFFPFKNQVISANSTTAGADLAVKVKAIR
jgi:hypothetical protein